AVEIRLGRRRLAGRRAQRGGAGKLASRGDRSVALAAARRTGAGAALSGAERRSRGNGRARALRTWQSASFTGTSAGQVATDAVDTMRGLALRRGVAAMAIVEKPAGARGTVIRTAALGRVGAGGVTSRSAVALVRLAIVSSVGHAAALAVALRSGSEPVGIG